MLALVTLLSAIAFAQSDTALDAQAEKLRALMKSSDPMPLTRTNHPVVAPQQGWAMDMVSSVASDASGNRYLLQRGAKADPVIVVDGQGRILRSWGKGLFTIPHSIRVDPTGNVWTVDAGSSMVYKFSKEGAKLLEISVGGIPAKSSGFAGTTDIAFAPNGQIYVADGYGNARILVYDASGVKQREWGTPGSGPGQFKVPHGIAIDRYGTVFVADRENGRIQRFDLSGKYLGEWGGLGKTFSITISRSDDLFIGTQPRNQPNGAPGWLARIDKKSGAVLGVVESGGHHSIDVLPDGELITGMRPDVVLLFRRR